MKRFLALLLLTFACSAWSQTADDQYLTVYDLIQQGETFQKDGQAQLAAQRYDEAQRSLQKLKQKYPTWNPGIVEYRTTYLAAKLAALPKIASATNQVARPVTSPSRSAETAEQINRLNGRVQELERANQNLQAKLQEALSIKPAVSPEVLARTEQRLVAVEKERDLLKATLQDAQTNSKTNNSAAPKKSAKDREFETRLSETSDKLRMLEGQLRTVTQERDQLRKQTEKAASTSSKKNGNNTANREIAELRARVAVLEAKPAPYTAEELALINKSQPQIAKAESAPTQSQAAPPTASVQAKKPVVKQPPAGAGALAAEAERAFATRRYDEAEKKFTDLLRQDEDNLYTLANLASAQLELNRTDAAEKHLQHALNLDPDDAFSLNLMGKVKFRQGKLDDALNALSRSAEVDPKSAETQNYLGIVLSEKGQRVPAEAALRKAIQLQPNYAPAHYHLAIVYATQKPPFNELARFHYQKATSFGHPANKEIEKMINP